MNRLSIRWRLTLWYAVALAFVLTAFCMILLFLTRQQLVSRTDAALQEELRELVLELQLSESNAGIHQALHSRFFQHDVYDFLVVDADGQVLFSSHGISSTLASSLPSIKTVADIHYFNHSAPADDGFRVAGLSVQVPMGTVAVYALTTLNRLQADLRTLQLVMLILIPLGVVLALAGGYFLAAQALAPVDQIVRVAETITISNLHQRIEIMNPRDELGRLATTLNLLIARLEQAVEEIQRFTADASHELRTPLAALRAEAELAMRIPRSAAEYQRTLGVIVDEATRLGRLADQLLSLSRHDSGIAEMRRRPVVVELILADVIEQLQSMARDKEIQLEGPLCDEQASSDVCGDELLLHQAFFNIVENAIKYTPQQGGVIVRLERHAQELVITIRDTGIGIGVEHLPHVFNRFYRVDPSRNASCGGAGLGLSIAQTAIAKHEGTLEIRSEIDRGTLVLIRLPAAPVLNSPESGILSRSAQFAPLLLSLSLALSGCQPAKSSPKGADSPAKTTHPISELSLNKIELTEEAMRRLGVQTKIAEERTMIRQRPYGADIVLPTGASVIVSAPLAGKLSAAGERDFLEPGQHVQQDAVLLRLLPLLSPERSVLTPAERIRFAEAKNALAQSRIDAEGLVQQATVQVDAAKIALERAERLLKEKAGTARAVDEAAAQLQLAEKSLAAANARKAQVQSVNLDEEPGTLEPIAITSPLTGIVRSVQVRPGVLIAAGSPLFEVMNEDLLWVKAPVYVGDFDELDLSQPARLSMLDGRPSDSDLMVNPVALPPTAVPMAAAVDVYYAFPNKERKLQTGQKVTAHIRLRGETRQLAIPWSAVIHDIYGGQWVYEQTAERTFVRRRVDIGWVQDNWAAVRRGIGPGTSVVTAAAAELAGTEFGLK